MSKQELKELERRLRDSLRKVRKEGNLSKKQEEQQLKELESEGFSGKSEATGISFCEILSGRDSQQDAMFVGVLGDPEAVNNPAEFYQGILTRMEKEHRECNHGTTICSAIVKPSATKGGLPTITTANLGDSRASLVIKYNASADVKNPDYQYKSVSLTEDHSLDVLRCRQKVELAGGRITDCIHVKFDGVEEKMSIDLSKNNYGLKPRKEYSRDGEFVNDIHEKLKIFGTIAADKGIEPQGVRVGDKLKLAAAIGDSAVGGIMKTPDIWEHNLAQIYRDLKIDPDQVEDVDLVVACDGLWDVTDQTNKYTSKDGRGLEFVESVGEIRSVASAKWNYDVFQTRPASDHYGKSFAEFLTYGAPSEKNEDNISVIHVPLIVGKQNKVIAPIIATVCDGHGDSKNISPDDPKATQDGALVSASVAAQLFVAAKVQSDMTITKTGSPHDYLQEFIEREKDLKHHLQLDEQENNRRRIANDVNNILKIIPPSTASLTANKTNSSSSPAVFDAKLEGISGTSKSTGISYREILGPRDSQQDAMFVGTLGNAEVVKDTRKFYQDTINQMTQDHLQCNAGTTLCSAVVKPAEDGGWPSVTTANLGDSRAALVIKHQVFKGGKAAIDAHGQPVYDFRTVSLTEDHSPDVKRCADHVQNSRGMIIRGRVNGDLGVVGTFGDHDVAVIEEGDADCLLRTPDIWEYDLSKICKDLKIEASHVENIDLVVACDGVWDAIKNDYEYKANVNGQDKADKMQVDSTKFQRNIVGGSAMSTLLNNNNLDPDQLAESLVTQALKANSSDNFSAITIPLVKGKKSKILEPIMATVCDGHGGLDNTPPETLNIASAKNIYDGALVSASVAAQLFVAANVRKIADMSENIVGNPCDYFSDFVEVNKQTDSLKAQQNVTPESMEGDDLNNLKVSLKDKGWQPDTVISNPSAIQLSAVRTILHAPEEIAQTSYWSDKYKNQRSSADQNRGNKFKTVDGVYDDGDPQKRAEIVMLDIIISVANKGKANGQPISLEDALGVIQKAQARGGVAHNKIGGEPEFEPWEKKFSKDFQSKCQECGILSGREDSNGSKSVKKHVGLRTTYIPLDVIENLKAVIKHNGNKEELVRGAESNIADRQQSLAKVLQMKNPASQSR